MCVCVTWVNNMFSLGSLSFFLRGGGVKNSAVQERRTLRPPEVVVPGRLGWPMGSEALGLSPSM